MLASVIGWVSLLPLHTSKQVFGRIEVQQSYEGAAVPVPNFNQVRHHDERGCDRHEVSVANSVTVAAKKSTVQSGLNTVARTEYEIRAYLVPSNSDKLAIPCYVNSDNGSNGCSCQIKLRL